MNYDLTGKVAVVTGASRGIGSGIALDLAKNGATIIGVYVQHREKARDMEQSIRELGNEVMYIQADVSSEQDVERLKMNVLGTFGSVDLLVNNAGIHQHLKSWEIDLEDWNKVIATNLTSQFLVTRAFLPGMKEQGSGRIINISSCAAYSGTDHEVHYAASKSGTIALTKSLALELADYNINVNAIAPGYIDTDMVVFDSIDQEKEVLASIPMKRLGQPEDIAKMASFLCSSGADYITGQMFHVNGGIVMP